MYAASALAPNVSSTATRQPSPSHTRTNTAYSARENPAPNTRYDGLPARWLITQNRCGAFSGFLLSWWYSSFGMAGATNGGSASRDVASGSSTRDRHDRPYPSAISTAPHSSSLPKTALGDPASTASQASDPTSSGVVQVRKPSGPPSIPGR